MPKPPPPYGRPPRLPARPVRQWYRPLRLSAVGPQKGRAFKPAQGFLLGISPPVRAAPGRGVRRCRRKKDYLTMAYKKVICLVPKRDPPLVIASDTCRSGSGFPPLAAPEGARTTVCCNDPPTPWMQQTNQPFDTASGTDRWPERRTPIQALRSGRLLFKMMPSASRQCKAATHARVTIE